MWALELSLDGTVVATSLVSALIAALISGLVTLNPDPHHHGLWSGPFAFVALIGGAMAAAQGVVDGIASPARWVVAAAAAIWLVATVVAATRLAVEELRLTALAFLGASIAAVGWAAALSYEGWTIWLLAVAVAFTTVAAAGFEAVVRHGWRSWATAASVGLHAAGIGFAVLLLPDRSLLIIALIAAGSASLVADFVFGLNGAKYLAPGLLFGAWASFVTELGVMDVQWFAPPFALAVLIDVEMMRRSRRRADLAPVSTEEMVVVELLAIGLAVSPSLVQVVFDSPAYGLLAILWGVVIAVWGAGTRVRRRVLAGSASAALGALLMIGVPLAELLPEFRGPALWAAVFAIGAVLIAVAATLEQARRRITEITTSFAAMTQGWE